MGRRKILVNPVITQISAQPLLGVLGKLGPGQLGPGQLGPGQLGPGQLGPGAQLYALKKVDSWYDLQILAAYILNKYIYIHISPNCWYDISNTNI